MDDIVLPENRDNSGRFKKGHSLHRQPGFELGINKRMRQILRHALTESIEKIEEDMRSLTSKERLQALQAFMPFLMPRLSSIEVAEVPQVEELLALSPEERQEKITELRKEIAMRDTKNKRQIQKRNEA